MNSQRYGGRLFMGTILVLIGVLLLLDNLNIMPISLPGYVFSWKMLLVVIGVFILINSDHKAPGVILITIGGIFLAPEIFHLNYHNIFSFWPLLLVFMGLSLLFKKKATAHCHNKPRLENFMPSSADILDEVAIFGGTEKKVISENFKGGKIETVFGGVELDLRNCKLAEGQNLLEITAIFGGVTIIAPPEWTILVDITPVFGGVSDERMQHPSIIKDNSKELQLKGFLVFGGVEIKN
jgi:predicted membrane protein